MINHEVTPMTTAHHDAQAVPWDVFTWMRQVRDSDLPSSTRLILLTMVTWLDNSTGTCFPSLSTMASGTGLSKSTVATHLKYAQEAGYISRTRRLIGNEHTSTLYQAHILPGYTPSKGPRITLVHDDYT